MANEKRLIPLQKRYIYAGDVFNSLMSEKGWSVTETADFVKAFRTVDAVEVVRCKDCKHCIRISRVFGDVRCGKLYTDYIQEDDFCSYGEKRKEA